jgi:hypothetical protein
MTPCQPSRVEQLNTAMDNATAAMISGDFATALTQALVAQAIAATLPQAARGQGPGSGSQSTAWKPEAIDQFIIRLRQAQAASIGVQVANNQYVMPQALAGENDANMLSQY